MHDSMAGSGVGAAYRAHDSNSPNEVSFIASSEWVGLGKIVVPLRTAAGFRRLRRYRGRSKTVGTRNLSLGTNTTTVLSDFRSHTIAPLSVKGLKVPPIKQEGLKTPPTLMTHERSSKRAQQRDD